MTPASRVLIRRKDPHGALLTLVTRLRLSRHQVGLTAPLPDVAFDDLRRDGEQAGP